MGRARRGDAGPLRRLARARAVVRGDDADRIGQRESDRRRRRARRLFGLRSTANLFATIGLAPLLGRTFEPDDGAWSPSSSARVLVAPLGRRPGGRWPHDHARRRAASVVGVVPRDFRFPYSEKDVSSPLFFRRIPRQRGTTRGTSSRSCAPRSLEAARAEMRAISAALEAEEPATGRGASSPSCRCATSRPASLRRSWRCLAPSRSCC